MEEDRMSAENTPGISEMAIYLSYVVKWWITHHPSLREKEA
jgi:hypothetical protein